MVPHKDGQNTAKDKVTEAAMEVEAAQSYHHHHHHHLVVIANFYNNGRNPHSIHCIHVKENQSTKL